MLLTLVISPLTTHPFRDGAPFLLLVETPPTFWRALRLFCVFCVKNGCLPHPFPIFPHVDTHLSPSKRPFFCYYLADSTYFVGSGRGVG